MKLFCITSNAGKYTEVTESLSDLIGLGLERLELPYPEIQADSLRAVVEFALDWLTTHPDDRYRGSALMIDDSGLFVERLQGFPGVYSAYVQKTLNGYRAILELMDGEWDRRAYFETCIGLITSDGRKHIFTGLCRGTLSPKPRGTSGFGYDPIFIPDGEQRTFAEMTTAEKNKYSHRGKAIAELKNFLMKK